MSRAPTIHDMRHAPAFWARHKPNDTAFGFMARGEEVTESLSFSALDARVTALAGMLGSRIPRGEAALLVYAPGLDFIAAILACFLAGAIAVPTPPPISERARARIATIRSASGARYVLTTRALAQDSALRASLGQDCAWIETDLAPGDHSFTPGPWEPDDVALVQFTSGSTADPRGVTITFGNLMANHAMIAPMFGADPSEPSVTWLPAFHDMGLIGTILYPLQAGRSTYLMPPFAFLQKPVRWLKAISKLGATGSGGPSFAYDLCARMVSKNDCEGLDLSSWRTAFCGAEPIRMAALQRFVEAFAPVGFAASALLPCYGLAEATLFVSGGPPGKGIRSYPSWSRSRVGPFSVISDQCVGKD